MNKEEYWEKYDSGDLCEQFAEDFNIWWDPDRFDWINGSLTLCEYLPHKFDTWWDPEKFYWGVSWVLCEYLPHKFDTWWDPKKFDWNVFSNKYLYKYLLNRFVIWYDFKNIRTDLSNYINNMEWNYD